MLLHKKKKILPNLKQVSHVQCVCFSHYLLQLVNTLQQLSTDFLIHQKSVETL